MLTKIKSFIDAKKQVVAGAVAVPATVVGTAMPAFASGGNTTDSLTQGVTDFMAIVSTMLTTITSNAILMVAFSASFVFLAVSLVRRLKRP